MKKKNTLSLKWILGVAIFLMAVVYGTEQISKGTAFYFLSKNKTLAPIIQFLENMLGIKYQSILSNDVSNDNTVSGQNGTMLNHGHLLASGGASSNTLLPNGTASNGNTLQATGSRNLSGVNPDNTLGSSAGLNGKNSVEMGGENNTTSIDQGTGNAEEINAEYNAEYNSEITSSNAENNSNGNSETNSDQGSTGQGSETSSDNNQGGNSGSNPDQGSGNSSGNNSGNLNPANLPTINPIPSDNAVSQRITQQDQQSDALAALLASRKALVVPVQQQAESSKYQTVNANSLPSVSTNPAPSDIVAKVRSNQLSLH